MEGWTIGNVVILQSDREDSDTWTDKYFKLIDNNLYIFRREQDKKAENVYNLSEWSVSLRRPEDEDDKITEVNESYASETSIDVNAEEVGWIALEDPVRLGCAFKQEDMEKTKELYRALNKTSV